MSTHEENRVLSRRGARIMTDAEVTKVSGGGFQTETACSFDPKTNRIDGDVFTNDCIAH